MINHVKETRPEPTPRDENGLIVMTARSQVLFDALQSLPKQERDAIIQNCIAVRAREKSESLQRALDMAEQRRAANPKQEDNRTYTKRPAYKTPGTSNEGEGMV